MLRPFALPALALLFAAACAAQAPPPASPVRGSSTDRVDADAQGMNVWRSYQTMSVAPCQVAPVALTSAAPIDWGVVGTWPGAVVASHRPNVGQESGVLAGPIERIVDLRLHGEPAAVTIGVRFRGLRHERDGDVLIFYVAIDATQSDAGMCHRWTSEARPSGEIVLAASDGALVSLRLRGPMTDTEALCTEGANESGISAEPKTCNRGEMRVEVGRGNVALPMP